MSDLSRVGHEEMSQGGRWEREQQEQGLRARCSRPKFDHYSLCKGHLIRARMNQWSNNRPECKQYRPKSVRGRGGTDPLFALAEQMIQRLEEQDFKCAVTGELIDLTTNAQMDHIIGIPERPDLTYELSNLRWVSEKANKGVLRRTGKQSGKENRTPAFRVAVALERALQQTANYELENPALAQRWSDLQKEIEAFCKELQDD